MTAEQVRRQARHRREALLRRMRDAPRFGDHAVIRDYRRLYRMTVVEMWTRVATRELWVCVEGDAVVGRSWMSCDLSAAEWSDALWGAYTLRGAP